MSKQELWKEVDDGSSSILISLEKSNNETDSLLTFFTSKPYVSLDHNLQNKLMNRLISTKKDLEMATFTITTLLSNLEKLKKNMRETEGRNFNLQKELAHALDDCAKSLTVIKNLQNDKTDSESTQRILDDEILIYQSEITEKSQKIMELEQELIENKRKREYLEFSRKDLDALLIENERLKFDLKHTIQKFLLINESMNLVQEVEYGPQNKAKHKILIEENEDIWQAAKNKELVQENSSLLNFAEESLKQKSAFRESLKSVQELDKAKSRSGKETPRSKNKGNKRDLERYSELLDLRVQEKRERNAGVIEAIQGRVNPFQNLIKMVENEDYQDALTILFQILCDFTT